MDITKEELVELIKSTVTTMNAEPSTTEEVVVNQGDSVSLNQGNEPTKPNEPAKEESKEETSTSEEKKTEETPKEEPSKEEPEKDAKASEKKDAKASEEVIKEEVLNSAPTTTVPKVEEEWRNLKGEEFRKWCDEHSSYCRNYHA